MAWSGGQIKVDVWQSVWAVEARAAANNQGILGEQGFELNPLAKTKLPQKNNNQLIKIKHLTWISTVLLANSWEREGGL